MVVTGIGYTDGPISMRFPRGGGVGVPLMEEGWEALPIGKAEILRHGDDVLILGYGSMVYPAMQTAEILSEHGIQATVVNARFAKPLDEALILPLAEQHGRVVTMEEGCLIGGFGSGIAEALLDAQIPAQVVRLGVPDVLVDHATPDQSKAALGLTPPQMAETILTKFKLSQVSVLQQA
jgi:1-deoxy-D-xylulose-5-phosphate synthase